MKCLFVFYSYVVELNVYQYAWLVVELDLRRIVVMLAGGLPRVLFSSFAYSCCVESIAVVAKCG
jgi:hypothetical protein